MIACTALLDAHNASGHSTKLHAGLLAMPTTIATLDGAVVGLISGFPGMVLGILVSPANRHQGIGSALLRSAITASIKGGARELVAHSQAFVRRVRRRDRKGSRIASQGL